MGRDRDIYSDKPGSAIGLFRQSLNTIEAKFEVKKKEKEALQHHPQMWCESLAARQPAIPLRYYCPQVWATSWWSIDHLVKLCHMGFNAGAWYLILYVLCLILSLQRTEVTVITFWLHCLAHYTYCNGRIYRLIQTHHAETHSSTSCCLSACVALLLKLFKLMRVKQRWRNPCLDASPVNSAAKSEELPWLGWSQHLKNSGVSQDKWAHWATVLGQ